MYADVRQRYGDAAVRDLAAYFTRMLAAPDHVLGALWFRTSEAEWGCRGRAFGGFLKSSWIGRLGANDAGVVCAWSSDGGQIAHPTVHWLRGETDIAGPGDGDLGVVRGN
ncbi:hypothetical protein [Tateyamaria omphalii]|uniref:Uncharacterized protein n=1 Tax=Tateyamaria omphalii TaxID=299262 RepID=A0A1P8MWU4_9RHOB|nr:hypothetical protein [Tateyamaria omphalii]APX12555.1 hypothetical protein BWR18_13350 [Tateyamaria omphalii]